MNVDQVRFFEKRVLRFLGQLLIVYPPLIRVNSHHGATTMKTPEQLASDWLTAKRAEQAAQATRLQIEQELLSLVPAKPEGSSTTVLENGLRLKSQGKLMYKADVDRLLVLTKDWPEKPVKTKVEADEALLKAIRMDRPDLWRQIAPAISLKPAKTYITIEEQQNGL
jgi:hypothetical protein